MLNNIVELSLRYKVLVLVAFVIVIMIGVKTWRELPVDAFPDVTPVQVNVYTESPGLAAEDVEKLLTTPNPEADADRRMFERLGLKPLEIRVPEVACQ